jgi:hypothetical protein
MKYLQNEARKQKSVKEVALQFSMIFQIRLKNNNANFHLYINLSTVCSIYCTFSAPKSIIDEIKDILNWDLAIE